MRKVRSHRRKSDARAYRRHPPRDGIVGGETRGLVSRLPRFALPPQAARAGAAKQFVGVTGNRGNQVRATRPHELIARNWDDLLRLAGSLKMSTVGAVELLHSLQGGGRVSTLGRALTELGRGPKTLHLLSYFDDEDHRRYIGRQLVTKAATSLPAPSSTAGKANSASPIGRAWKISSALWAWSSM